MTPPLRVLYVTPELSPWIKAGGLGDVARDLPVALAREGADVRILVPAYPALRAALDDAVPVAELGSPGGELAPARLLEAQAAVPLYLIECGAYYDRPGGAYQSPEGVDWPDNDLRFGLLSRAAARLGGAASPLDWRPDVVHCNDWQAGLAPAYLAFAGGPRAATVMTIHNLAYQGLFPRERLAALALPEASFQVEGLEFYGRISFLKAGLHYADRITTVSPTYAQEIQTPALGFGLEGLLRRRAPDLTGILNGIDTLVWDPARDPHLATRYDGGHLQLKRENKLALQRAFGLPEGARAPLLGMVSRLVEQKGVDLVPGIAPLLVRSRAQLVVLGSGDAQLQDALRALAAGYPRVVAVQIGFDDSLAHRIEAGADMFLMPSRFEPCGLNQLYSMRYGTPPIVRRTGGLADSVVDASEANLRAGTATGFVFGAPTRAALRAAVKRALEAYHHPKTWRFLQLNGMARDSSWERAARATIEVYRGALAVSSRA
jgi:starch synthase